MQNSMLLSSLLFAGIFWNRIHVLSSQSTTTEEQLQQQTPDLQHQTCPRLDRLESLISDLKTVLEREGTSTEGVPGQEGGIIVPADKCEKFENNLANHARATVAFQQVITQQIDVMASKYQAASQQQQLNTSRIVQLSEQRLEDRIKEIHEKLDNMSATNVCLSSPCQHGGICMKGRAGYNCTCTKGYAGKNCQNALCPDGFQFFPELNYCYKVVLVGLNWTQSRDLCSQINPRSQLAIVINQAQDDAIASYLKTFNKSAVAPCSIEEAHAALGGYVVEMSFFTAAQRQVDGDCNTPFVWKSNPTTYIPLSYTNWPRGEPNCAKFTGYLPEGCLHYCTFDKGQSYKWNDIPCSFTGCPVCEYAL